MTVDHARRLIVLLSLGTTTAFTAFLIVSPLFIQVDIAEAYRVVQIIFPVFAGYLGAAVLYLFQRSAHDVIVADPVLLRYIVYGAFLIFWLLGLVLFLFYYVSNLPGGIEGMRIDQLSNYMTMLIAVLNITVGALSTFLFRADPTQFERKFTPPER